MTLVTIQGGETMDFRTLVGSRQMLNLKLMFLRFGNGQAHHENLE